MRNLNTDSGNYIIEEENGLIYVHHSTTNLELDVFQSEYWDKVSVLHLRQLAGQHEARIKNLIRTQAFVNDLHLSGLVQICETISNEEKNSMSALQLEGILKKRAKSVIDSGFWKNVNSHKIELPKELPKTPELVLISLAKLTLVEKWTLFQIARNIVSDFIDVFGEIPLCYSEKIWREKVSPSLSIIMMYS